MAIVLVGAAGAGCAGPATVVIPHHPPNAGAVNQGQAWEVVLRGRNSAAETLVGEESWRRDDLLAVGPESDLPADAWPAPYRPGLDRVRRLFLSGQAGEVVYTCQGPFCDWPTVRWWRP